MSGQIVLIRKTALIHKFERVKLKYPIPFKDIDMDKVDIYLDISTEPHDVIKIIKSDYKKFLLIVRTILKGDYNKVLYKKEDDFVYAMRFSAPNSRIYCQDLKLGDFNCAKMCVIMSRALENKTSQKNNNTNNPIIDAIKTYRFTIKMKKNEQGRKLG